MRRALLALALTCTAQAQTFLADDPMAKWPAPRNTTTVKPRHINEYFDFFQNVMFRPGELAMKTSTGSIPAKAVNTMGEVPDSEWYTNRHYRRTMSTEELMRGPGNTTPPSMEAQWRVVSAKNEGITPGFTIEDKAGRRYLLKFDPPSNPEMASAADVISSKFLYALGYNVPENYVVRFKPEQLKIDATTKFTDNYGKRRIMTSRDMHQIMEKVSIEKDGTIRALASRFIPGTPVGPFRFDGTRSDDPNDTVVHEHRRDLRGLRLFAAWLGHDDSKALNSLDTLVKENGVAYVRHYLIDFGASLGSASYGPNSPRSGSDYLFAWGPAARQFLTFGMSVPKWAHAKYPDLPAVGAFEYRLFDPEHWVPEYPNTAFSNMDDEDAFWAARQIMNFSDDEIRAIVATGVYSDPKSAEWVTRCLIERRDKIGRAFLARVLPVDQFAVRDGRVEFTDLTSKYFDKRRTYQMQWFTYDNKTGERQAIAGAASASLPVSESRYLAMQVSDPTTGHATNVYVRDGHQIVGRQNGKVEPQLLSLK